MSERTQQTKVLDGVAGPSLTTAKEINKAAEDRQLAVVDGDVYVAMNERDMDQVEALINGAYLEEYVYTVEGGKGFALTYAGILEAARHYEGISCPLDHSKLWEIPDEPATGQKASWCAMVEAIDRKTGSSRLGTAQVPKMMKKWDRSTKPWTETWAPDPFAMVKALSCAQRNAIHKCLPGPQLKAWIQQWASDHGVPLPTPTKSVTKQVQEDRKDIARKRFFAMWDKVMAETTWNPKKTTLEAVRDGGRRAFLLTITGSDGWSNTFGDGAQLAAQDSIEHMSAAMLDYCTKALEARFTNIVDWLSSGDYRSVIDEPVDDDPPDDDDGGGVETIKTDDGYVVTDVDQEAIDMYEQAKTPVDADDPEYGEMISACEMLIESIIEAVEITTNGDHADRQRELIVGGMRKAIMENLVPESGSLDDMRLEELRSIADRVAANDTAIRDWLQKGEYLVASKANRMPRGTRKTTGEHEEEGGR
ncbi:MAG: hypothetical protein JXB46_02935 [Candidatus Eisenbacteria bacterium]|nr:hypothetical protein [Candidatus Eisenbacteria bacterium]